MKKTPQNHTVQPKTKEELQVLIKAEIKKNGNQCDLNHIDVSLVNSLSYLFYESKFNGDISKWDVSSVKDMNAIFSCSTFNGDISKWDVSSMVSMEAMFYRSEFKGDISSWDVSSVIYMSNLFERSKFKGNISGGMFQAASIWMECLLDQSLREMSLSGKHAQSLVKKIFS